MVMALALIFVMKHFLVDLYQVCSYDAPGIKIGPALWVTSLNIGTKRASLKILLLSETGWPRALIFGI